MRVFLGDTIIDQLLDARGWVAGREFKPLFVSLERWIETKETQGRWGDCYVFVETPLPTHDTSKGSHNQIDMLICFSDRIALCELKRHSGADQLVLDKIYRQLDGQIKWLKGLCRQNVVNKDGFLSPFLLLPNFDLRELTKIRTAWIDRYHGHHILPVGTASGLKEHRDGNNNPFHLIEALEERLSRSGSPTKAGQLPLQLFLHKKLEDAGSQLQPFGNFNEAIAYLRDHITSATAPIPAAHYVSNLRLAVLGEATDLLHGKGIVEVIGAPEIGKSVLAKEIIQRSGYGSWELELSQCKTPHAICSKINDGMRGDSPQSRGYEEFLRMLAKEPLLFWVRKYDALSAKSLEELLRVFKSFKSTSEEVHARWIVESTRALPGLDDCRCELVPLDNQGISRILQKVRGGGAFDDPEEVVRLAQGNPGRAIRYWQSLVRTDVEAGDEFEWFRRQLSRDEARILPILCMATERSPLGLTQGLLSSLVSGLHLDLPATLVQTSVTSLVKKIELRHMATISRLDSQIFPHDIISRNSSVTVINDVASGLRESVLKELDEESLKAWEEKLHDVLWDAAETHTLAHVTVEINLGDLEPFLRSSFRFTHLSRLIAWIEQTEWRYKDARQAYLLKALRVLLSIGKRGTANVEVDLGKPQPGDSAQNFAYHLAKIKGITFSRVNERFDLHSWLQVAGQQTDPELQAEIYLSAAMALPKSNRPNRAGEIWEILDGLWERYEPLSVARCRVIQESLAFLNRGKLRKGAVDDNQAYGIVQLLSRELLAAGVKVENLQLISDALFYHIRSQELQAGREHSPRVLTYLPALKFIEEAQGKTIRTIQVLLTQGSAHRHFLRQDRITWDQARPHFEDGFESYTRAFYSALAKRHVLHILNSTSYMMSLCCKGLRFADDIRARDRIAERSEQALTYADQALRDLDPSTLDEEARSIHTTILMSYAVLLYVTAVSGPEISEETRKLFRASFRTMVDQLLEDAEPGGAAKIIERSRKNLTTTMTDLIRALRFGQYCSKVNRNLLMKEIISDAQNLVDGTRRIKKNGKPLSQGLSTIISGWLSSAN